MERRSLSERIEIPDDLITKACSLSMAAHTSLSPTYYLDKPIGSTHAIIAFPGSWSIDDWFARKSFGESKINSDLFPSLKSISNAQFALVNESFLRQFKTVLSTSNLQDEVRKALAVNKQIVFTGHSSGAPIAIFATIWLLEQLKHYNYNQCRLPFCITFGSPLIGDRVFGHALQRENWSNHFIHFINRHDIVPRILLASLSSIERELLAVLHFFNPKSSYFSQDSIARSQEALDFLGTVMRNASYVASHAACLFMGCTNSLLQTVTSIVELSPYKPFGTYVFCTGPTGNRKLVTVKNPEAVLQILFYSLQLRPEQELAEVAYRSLQEHIAYELELQESLPPWDVVPFDDMEQLPLSAEGADNNETKRFNAALNDLGLCERARICLRAAGELEKQKHRNQGKIESYITKIEEALKMLEGYRATCEVHELGYYDAFKFQREIDDFNAIKFQKENDDFNANVKRQELAGMWDEIKEMLKRYELPDDFESQDVWVNLGTKYRRLVEPLDIANYYGHHMNDDTGPYMIKGRPRRYRFTQRWLEQARNMAAGSCSESCFWADVEELRGDASSGKTFEEVKERVMRLERDVLRWANSGEIGGDVFLEETSFVKWWKSLPSQHRSGSCIAELMNGEGRKLPTLNQTHWPLTDQTIAM